MSNFVTKNRGVFLTDASIDFNGIGYVMWSSDG